MYYVYIRVVILGVLSRHSSIYRSFTNCTIERIVFQFPEPANSCITYTLGLSFSGCFRVIHLFIAVLQTAQLSE